MNTGRFVPRMSMILAHTAQCLIAVLLIFVCGTTDVFAGKFNRQLSVGDVAPSWDGLRGVDGKLYSLKHWADAKAVVVVFYSNRCPVVEAYEPRLKQLAADFTNQGVKVLAVSVSHHAADGFEKMQQRAHDRALPFPYVQDLTQELGRNYGAITTAQVFVLDVDRKIAYMGAIDDQPKDAAKIENPYLRNALKAILAGKSPDITETRPVGCEIEYVSGPRQ